jgi:ferredoxin
MIKTKINIEDIINKYINVTCTVTQMAKDYGVTPRSIQRQLKNNGVTMRSISQANKVTAKLKDYSSLRVPEHLKVKRKHIKSSLRYKIISEHPFCVVCGNTASVCPLCIDHVDGNPSNNILSNLQVLCILCNQGKK